ncbi:SIR2 family protein [Clostridium algidicarnis]|uniref:SIR2 family NAD-dependent protein deacylase n=1 Tax=Clostridium algidicarnis TaxID=37659 RepID=UPI001C0DFFA8|nr:SIR2 family protein [Clostridium algidicarnis]MBU3196532.1 SIR2 family protein [Clostridium algidicarnis]
MSFEEIMAFNAPYNQINFDSLIEKIKSNAIVPYIGAGISMLFKDVYPSWSGFLNTTFNKFVDISEKNKFNGMSYEDKADFLYKEIGKLSFSNQLKTTFSKNHLHKEKCQFIDKPAYLLPAIFEEGLIITTNYDRVIEKVYGLYNLMLPVAHPGHFEALNGALRNNELLLYKIHGDINETIESIILTKKQYELAYNNPKLTESLKQIYTSKSMLFLGCSLQKDRPIELLCEVSKSGMSNYAIIPCKNEEKKDRRLQLEGDYYTQSIIYPEGNHECVKIILEQIVKIIKSEDKKGKKELMEFSCDEFNNKKVEETYLGYINKWCDFLDINNWEAWTSWMLAIGQPHISVEMLTNLEELREWLFSRVWPNKFGELQNSFENFKLVLNDLYNTFYEHCKKSGEMYFTEKFYKIDRWDEKVYYELSNEFEFHVDLMQDLTLELTRAANYICDNIRKYIKPDFRLEEGKLLVTYGPCMDFTFRTICPEYIGEERILKPYPGLEKFKVIRVNRDQRFGTGISSKDPEFLRKRY